MDVSKIVLAAVLTASGVGCGEERAATPGPLPKAAVEGKMSVEQALRLRRSVRDFRDEALSREQLAQLAWAAQGVTDKARGFRTAPSAGALYPIELYIVTAEAVYRYLPRRHEFEVSVSADRRAALAKAAVNQMWVADAPATFVVTAVYERTMRKYGQRGIRYATMEAGYVCQNLHLQAVALGLGSVSVGAFDDAKVQKLLGAPDAHRPLCLVPVGQPRAAPAN